MRTAIPSNPVVDDDGGAATVPAVSPVPTVLVSEKCALCLKVSSIAYQYYTSIGRAITPSNMNYTTVLKGFNIEYETFINLSKYTKPSFPLLYKNETPIKCI